MEDLPRLLTPAIDAAILVVFIILATRLSGLRSFSKMSSFDFTLTVATGSTVASVVTSPDITAWIGVVAIGAIFVLQAIIARGRVERDVVERVVDNAPLLLMAEGEIDGEALRSARLTDADLMNKLRTSGVSRMDEVRAVIFETTGDVSVLKGGQPISPELLRGVRGRLRDKLNVPKDDTPDGTADLGLGS